MTLSSRAKGYLWGIRPKISIKIGKTFGPLKLPVDKFERDKALEHIGKEVMLNIAALLPDECHGEYSADSLIYNIRKNIKAQWIKKIIVSQRRFTILLWLV